MAAGMESEEAVPVTAIQDDSLQRELFNLAGSAEDDADFDRMKILVTRFHCNPNTRNEAANYHYTPMHQAGEPSHARTLVPHRAADARASPEHPTWRPVLRGFGDVSSSQLWWATSSPWQC